ncbi:MAG: dihydrolipoyl dehydrogenase [Elusimicrobia bacterium]|nr:dihydrolipoyl dehydrogenase [Elusimicrobiota bacterium]
MNSKSVVVIGAGPGGEAAAKRAAELGAQVTIIERAEVGGLCLNAGCIPSKMLLEGGRLLRQVRSAAYLVGGSTASIHWDMLQEKKRGLVTHFRKSLEQRFGQLKIRLVRGDARFVSPHSVRVTGPEGAQNIDFETAVIATGSAPFFPPPFDPSVQDILDSDRVLNLTQVPKSLVVVGGGAVGLEFACLFHELGTAVTVVEKMPQLLPGEEASVSRFLQQSFEKRGIKVHTEQTVTSAEKSSDGWRITLSKGEECFAERVLVCVGRRASLNDLGLELAGVSVERGRIAVNDFMQTSRASIYAVGDVNGLSLLAHAAAVQGSVAVGHMMGKGTSYAHARVPRCLYTWPEVASVGEWTHSASIKDLEVKTQRFFFQGSAKALAAEEGEGFIQILSNKKDGRLLGAQIIGPHATELIHILSVALAAGQTVDQLRQVIFAHPTLSEGIPGALGR